MHKFKVIGVYCAILNTMYGPSTFAGNINFVKDIMVITNSKHDVSIPLRDINSPLNVNALILKVEKVHNTLSTIYSFQGIGVGLGSYVVTKDASQVAGAVGLTQYVQWVDPDIAVFDKVTGALAPGFPKPGSSIWSGFGGPCETSDVGAPNVKYDQIANRWVLTRQAYITQMGGPFYQCVAISTTNDATGSYYRYAFPMDSLSNFGKLGLWSDAYYLAATMYGPISNGPRACALDRDKLLLGLNATMQCKQLTEAQSNPLIPGDLGGVVLPPSGRPGFFFSIRPPFNILFFTFKPDFNNPVNSYFSSGIALHVTPFIAACASTDGKNCAVQPNTTTRLDLLSLNFASRIAYRQFPTYGSFVLTHSVQGSVPKLSPALRWYELRLPNDPTANPIIYQHATFQPNSMARYTGSMGIDKFNNIVIGYTVSSTAVYPSLEMASRTSTMPLNTLVAQAVFTGRGSQIGSSTWSNFSAISVDPIDDCTFWYTGQYLKTDRILNWSTAVTHFKLPGC